MIPKSPGLLQFWQSLLLLLLPAGLVVAAYAWFIQPSIRTEATQQFVTSMAETQARSLDNSLGLIANQLDGLTRQPELREALQNADTQILEQFSRRWAMQFSHLNRIAILPMGELGVAGLGEYKALLRNNIEKDMLHRAINSDVAIVDFYRVDQQYMVSLVKAVVAGNRKIGAIILTLESAWLADQLGDLHATSVESGAVELRYHLKNQQPEKIVGDTLRSDGSTITSAQSALKINSVVDVSYSVAEKVIVGRVAISMVAAAVVLSSVMGAFALSLLRKQLAYRFDRDASKLKRYLGESFESSPEKPDLQFESLSNVMQGFEVAYTKFREKFDVKVRDSAKAKPEKIKADANTEDWQDPKLSTDMGVVEEDLELNGEDEQSALPPAHIFRAYDIRGVVGEDLSIAHARHIGLAIGSKAQSAGNDTVVVARDGRLSSEELADSLIEGLLASGSDVVDIGLVPTPVLYFAVEHLQVGSGVMVTGSHNSPDYNGFKMVVGGEALVDEQIAELYEQINSQSFSQGAGSLTTSDLVDTYIDQIADDVVFASPIKIVLDCGNGVAGTVAPMLFASMGSEVIPLFADIDGSFPNHLPDPSVPSNLDALVREVTEQSADIGLAFDGDADRVVAVTAAGDIVEADQLLMLFAKDVLTRNPGADVVFDQKCSRSLSHLIANFGGRPIMWKSGHSRIKQKMLETEALLGGEYSGHFFFKERWFGFDDGLYSGARLIEMLTLEGVSLEEAVAQLPVSVSSPEISIPVDEENKFEVIARLQRSDEFEDGELSTLDGVRVDFASGWGLVRASNTSARLTARFEADTDEELQRIMSIFDRALSAQGISLQP